MTKSIQANPTPTSKKKKKERRKKLALGYVLFQAFEKSTGKKSGEKECQPKK